MSSNVVNQTAFVRTSRDFPKDDADQLSVELGKAYIDTANAINSRMIGLFPTNKPAQNGEEWYITNIRQQGFRKVFSFTGTAPIKHGIDFTSVDRFTRMFGTYTDGTNWYGMIAATSVAIPGQFTFYVTPTQILFLGPGAPATQGATVVLEWISKP